MAGSRRSNKTSATLEKRSRGTWQRGLTGCGGEEQGGTNLGMGRTKRNDKKPNNVEERKDKKPNQEPFGLKFGQSPLNKQPLMKQDKCNDKSKAQAEMNQSHSEGYQHRSEGFQRQSEENRHYSERFRGQEKRSRGREERPHGHTERSRSQSWRYHDQRERPCGQVERSCYYTERAYGQSERSHYHSERFHVHAKRSHDHSMRSKVLSKISYGRIGRFHGQSERLHDQSGRYQKYSPAETEPEFDRIFTMKRRNEYLQKQMQQRSDSRNMNRNISPENDHLSYEKFKRHERLKRHEIKSLPLTTTYATTKYSQHQPKGIHLDYNFPAIGNQTKLSLNERFSKLMKKNPGSASFED
nr:leucine zipper protein 4 [Odocoileus virginianus texanus]